MTPLFAVYVAAVVTTLTSLVWSLASHVLACVAARTLAESDRELEGL